MPAPATATLPSVAPLRRLSQISPATRTGRLDLLVNNAGVLTSGNFEDIDPRAHDLIADVNIKGFTAVAQVAFPLLKQTHPARAMVNLCSVSSVHGLPLLAVYSASKFYVNGLTEALGIEWAKYDIRVTAVKAAVGKHQKWGHSIRPELMEKFSVDMEPEEVAVAIQRAAEGKRTGYLLGGTSKAWGWLDKHLPEAGPPQTGAVPDESLTP